MDVRPLIASELDEAAATLARAFQSDPLFTFLLPDPERRARWLHWFQLRALREAHLVGGAFTVVGPGVGAIGLYPPGTWPASLYQQMKATPFPIGLPPWRLLTAGLHLERRMHEHHPSFRHVYVYVLGVDPSQHGRGCGGALLRHAAAMAREAKVRAHLETGNPANISLYQRFGYEVTHEITSHEGPPLWIMTTPERAASRLEGDA
ncbi:MAG: GNAT family N-acetyltransferase [Polyangiaceae bacterium]